MNANSLAAIFNECSVLSPIESGKEWDRDKESKQNKVTTMYVEWKHNKNCLVYVREKIYAPIYQKEPNNAMPQ